MTVSSRGRLLSARSVLFGISFLALGGAPACEDQMGETLEGPPAYDRTNGMDAARLEEDANEEIPSEREINLSDGAAPQADGGASAPDAAAPADAAVVSFDAGVPPSAKLFDDFEAYPLGGVPNGNWIVDTSGSGAVVVDGVHVRSGTKAVHTSVKKFTGDSAALIRTKSASVFPAPSHKLFGRLMMYMPQVPGNRHWTLIRGTGPSLSGEPAAPLVKYGFGINNGNYWQSEYFKPLGFVDYGYQDFNKLTAAPEQRWACVEWSMDAVSRSLRLWVDGAAVSSVSVDDHGPGQAAWYGPALDTAVFGIDSYNPGTSIDADLWIDDVVLGYQRMGCP